MFDLLEVNKANSTMCFRLFFAIFLLIVLFRLENVFCFFLITKIMKVMKTLKNTVCSSSFSLFPKTMPMIQTSRPNSSGLIRLWLTDKNASVSWTMEMDLPLKLCTRCSGKDSLVYE